MIRLILLRLLETYFRHRWLYLIPIVLLLGVAFVFLYFSKPKYIASGVLFVQKESLLARLSSVGGTEFSWQTPAVLTVGELREISMTDAFLRTVIQKTDLEENMDDGSAVVAETIDGVRNAVWTTTQGDNQVLVAATHEQPELAYQLAQATIETFVQWKINADKTDSEAASKFFADLSVDYKQEADQARQKLYDYLQAHPVPIKGERSAIEALEIAELQADLDLAISRFTGALSKNEDAQLAAAQAEENARQSYVVIDAPRLPDKSSISRKDIALQMAIFVAVGVILSGIAIVGAALLDRSLRFPVDVWHGVNLNVLTTVPDVTPVPPKEKRKWRKKVRSDDQEQESAQEIDLAPFPVGRSELDKQNLPELEGIDLPLLTQVPEIVPVSIEHKHTLVRKRRAVVPSLESTAIALGPEPPEELEPIIRQVDGEMVNFFESAVKQDAKARTNQKS